MKPSQCSEIRELIPCSNDSPFNSNIQYLFNKYSAPRGSSSSSCYFPLRHILLERSLARVAKPALQSLRSTWQEFHLFHKGSAMLIQKLLNLLLARINALFLHASTFLDIEFDAAMQQRFNRRTDRIFEWLGHVGICLYAKDQVQVLQAWQIWGTPVLHLIARQLRRFGTMPMFVKTAVTDIHRCDSCAMWQTCAGYSKHLQNSSLASLDWK